MSDQKKRFYWLKLKRDFFKRHDIRIIESMPNGKEYILFYLKLLCESVDHDGNLRFSDQIPYSEDMLSTITDTNVDWGTKPVWGQTMPSSGGQTATGWDYDLSVGITGNTTITAKYIPQHTATFVLAAVDSPTGSQYTLVSSKFDEGSTPVYNGITPTTAQGDTIEFTFTGWSPVLAPIYKDTIYVA